VARTPGTPERSPEAPLAADRQQGAGERLLQPMNEETHGRGTVGCVMTGLERCMPTLAAGRRKAAAPQAERIVKTSLVMGA
jgi:hypothetical protein